MRKLTKKIFSSLNDRKSLTTTTNEARDEKLEQKPSQQQSGGSALTTTTANSDDESPTTSLRKVPSTFNKPPPINTTALSNSYPRFLPEEIPSEGSLQFMKIPSFGTSFDADHKPFTVYCLEVRSTITMPSTWTVYRRFSQFCRLRQSLQDVDRIKLPELPPRPHEFSLDQTISRKRQLESWLHSLMEMHLTTPGMEPLIQNEHIRRFLTDSYNTEPDEFTLRYGSPRELPADHSLMNTPASPGGSKVSIHDFHVVTTIGKGAFGQVFLVKSKRDPTQLYAMKSIRRRDIVHERQYEIIERERQIMETLHCPYIVEMHYVLKTKESLFFVLDYCAGGELLFHLARLGRFPERMARFYCAELCLALEYLHDRDVLYRDLKPENILLNAQGHIKLVDFGLARSNVSSYVQGARTYCGTEQYLAPEVLDRSDYGKAVDWWSLGMILYEMLTGLPPWYDADNRQEVFAGIRYGVLKFPRYISRMSATLIQALLTRDPTRRLGSVTQSTLEVKEHPYFHDIDWIDLTEGQIIPPLIPCASPLDVHSAKNFEDEFKSMSVDAFCSWNELVDVPDATGFGSKTNAFATTTRSNSSNCHSHHAQKVAAQLLSINDDEDTEEPTADHFDNPVEETSIAPDIFALPPPSYITPPAHHQTHHHHAVHKHYSSPPHQNHGGNAIHSTINSNGTSNINSRTVLEERGLFRPFSSAAASPMSVSASSSSSSANSASVSTCTTSPSTSSTMSSVSDTLPPAGVALEASLARTPLSTAASSKKMVSAKSSLSSYPEPSVSSTTAADKYRVSKHRTSSSSSNSNSSECRHTHHNHHVSSSRRNSSATNTESEAADRDDANTDDEEEEQEDGDNDNDEEDDVEHESREETPEMLDSLLHHCNHRNDSSDSTNNNSTTVRHISSSQAKHSVTTAGMVVSYAGKEEDEGDNNDRIVLTRRKGSSVSTAAAAAASSPKSAATTSSPRSSLQNSIRQILRLT